jgi:enoyl-CoA hydratase/carnithine racemase
VPESLRFEVDAGLAWLTLDCPAARNAIDDELRCALLDALGRVAAEPAIRAVVLTATGDVFCPGADLATAAREWGTRLAQGPTFALGLSKRLLERAYTSSLDTCLEEEALAQSLVARSEDMAEGMKAFSERRPPVFKGR